MNKLVIPIIGAILLVIIVVFLFSFLQIQLLPVSCGQDPVCFNKALLKCSPASMEMPFMGAIESYKIIGDSNGFCQVTQTASWHEGGQNTCYYDENGMINHCEKSMLPFLPTN
ncbi:MAG: hypothetical protein WCW13_05910 [archaeon]|jgi:hypothetical protein